MTESFANCSCFYNLSHWGEFACRLHRYECTHISFFCFVLSLLYCFYFYNILYYVIFHWYWEFFLVEFCKVYGIANTSKYIAPNAFYVLYWLFLFLLWLWHVWIYLIILICQTSIMSICKMMYFVVLFLFFTFRWYWSWFSLTNKYHFEFCVNCTGNWFKDIISSISTTEHLLWAYELDDGRQHWCVSWLLDGALSPAC